MSRCLVTGGAGFIGSHVAEALVKAGHRVRILDDFSAGFKKNIASFASRVDLQRGDIRCLKDVRKAMNGIDYVFHLAANRAVLRSVDDPLETNDVNINGTLNVLLSARDAKVKRVVYSSSSSVYGETNRFPLKESDIPKPESPYAAQKVMGEYYCRLFSSLYRLETVSLRYFNVFGPRQNPESKYSAVIPIFIEALLQNQRPEIHWDGKQSRDFSYVDNIVHGNLCAMRTKNISGEVFNIACHDEYSVLDIFRGLRKILNKTGVNPRFGPKRRGDIRRTFADITKSKRLMKFRVQTRFQKGLEKTVDWFLEERR